MRVKTILNRIERQPGFVYEHARWSADGKRIEVTLRPAARTPPVCAGSVECRVLNVEIAGSTHLSTFQTRHQVPSAVPDLFRNRVNLVRSEPYRKGNDSGLAAGQAPGVLAQEEVPRPVVEAADLGHDPPRVRQSLHVRPV